jgi:multidrug efflux pump subunit AcrA (membrane-fusion protein)
VSGSIATNVRNDVLQVPVRAVTTSNGVSSVTVATKGKANGPTEVRTVKTGAVANGMVEITDGLKEGEQVVVTVLQFPTVAGNGTTQNGLPTGVVNGGVNGGLNDGFAGRGTATNGAGVTGR